MTVQGKLNPQLVFDRYVIGECNRLAAGAARRAAESPGRSYNPLVISGAPGTGKTHLLVAIAHLASSVDPELIVHYERAEDFVDRLTHSIATGTLDELITVRKVAGLWLIDDLQEVMGKSRTQHELVNIWDMAIPEDAQVVIALDRSPAEIPDIDPRLAERLGSGLSVELAPLDSETRRGIALQMLGDRGFELEPAVIEALAALPIGNGRDLRTAVDRVIAALEIEGRRLDPESLPELLGIDVKPPAQEDEFGGFVNDVSNAVAAMVETSPWRRRLAEAIMRWEGEGVRTRRLELALDTDSAPDVDALLRGFARDVARMTQLAGEVIRPTSDRTLTSDPDRLADLEALVASLAAKHEPMEPPLEAGPSPVRVDPWFLDRRRFAWEWVAAEERIIEEQR